MRTGKYSITKKHCINPKWPCNLILHLWLWHWPRDLDTWFMTLIFTPWPCYSIYDLRIDPMKLVLAQWPWLWPRYLDTWSMTLTLTPWPWNSICDIDIDPIKLDTRSMTLTLTLWHSRLIFNLDIDPVTSTLDLGRDIWKMWLRTKKNSQGIQTL